MNPSICTQAAEQAARGYSWLSISFIVSGMVFFLVGYWVMLRAEQRAEKILGDARSERAKARETIDTMIEEYRGLSSAVIDVLSKQDGRLSLTIAVRDPIVSEAKGSYSKEGPSS